MRQMGKRWTRKEKAELRRQAKLGLTLDQIHIFGRTKASITYKFYALKLRSPERWKRKETAFLRKQAKKGRKPWQIKVPGRSKTAIRNKMIRLKLWEPEPHPQKSWSLPKIHFLEHLVRDCGYTAKKAASNGYFPGRTKDSIGQQMRRLGIKRMRQ